MSLYFFFLRASLISVSIFSYLVVLLQFLYVKLFAKRQFSRHGCACPENAEGKLSIVIALRNEAAVIGKTIRNMEKTTLDKTRVELILVDAGCRDNTIDVIKASSGVIPIKIIKVGPGSARGAALNVGFAHCSGSMVLFLRADAVVPPGYDETIRRALSDRNCLMAAFRHSIGNRRDWDGAGNSDEMNSLTRIIDYFANLRSVHCLLPSASQGIAITCNKFRDSNGFPNQIVLEELSYIESIRNDSICGRGYILILEQVIVCSPFRWARLGILRGTLIDQCAQLAYLVLRMSPERIQKIFYSIVPRVTSWFKI